MVSFLLKSLLEDEVGSVALNNRPEMGFAKTLKVISSLKESHFGNSNEGERKEKKKSQDK